MDIPPGTLVDLKMTKNIPDDKLVIITTGSQGEPMSALSRIASGEHRSVKLKKGDMVILSSTPVPGNEKTVSNVVNKLFEKGAEVIYSDIADIHVSGHACQEELKLLHSLIKPKFFMPVHGEYRHLIQHARLAESLGMKRENIFVMENGDVLNVNKRKAELQQGKVTAEAILVDGLGVGDVGNIVLRDRKMLSESGLIIVVAAIEKESQMVVSGPDIISRGFVYVRENEKLIDEARKIAEEALDKCQRKKIKDWNNMKSQVRDSLSSYIYETTKRSPIILPIFLEVKEMNVYDQAHGLAQAIKMSEEYKQYEGAKAKINENEDLSKMIRDFQTKQFEFQAKQMAGQQPTQEDISSLQQLYGILLKDPLAAQYLETEMRFSLMMKDVYEILGEVAGMGQLMND